MNQRKRAIDAVASNFGALSEPTRTRIMGAGCEEEKTVSQIVEELGASQTNVSCHLGIMHRKSDCPTEEPESIWNSTNCAALPPSPRWVI